MSDSLTKCSEIKNAFSNCDLLYYYFTLKINTNVVNMPLNSNNIYLVIRLTLQVLGNGWFQVDLMYMSYILYV